MNIPSDTSASVLLDALSINAAIDRIADEIHRAHAGLPVALVGIYTRGVVLAERLADRLANRPEGLLRGTLDISLYRDDLDNLAALPQIRASDIPFEVEGARIVLCDDVLFTGRTIRAALNEITDYGRPACIELAVLVDRGHRELPIAARYVGHAITTRKEEYVRVRFTEIDGTDSVVHQLAHPRSSA